MTATDVIMDVAWDWDARKSIAEEAVRDGNASAQAYVDAAQRVDDFLGDVYYHARAVEHYAQEARAEKAKLGTIMPDGFPY